MCVERKRLSGRSWLYVAMAAVMLMILAGCGGKSAEPASAGSKQDNKIASAADADTRTITDAYGEVQIPAQASRIVVLDIGALDNLLELGIKPIGAPSILTAGDPFPAYLKGTEGIKNIGSVNEPNLEAIDALKPDLIIGNKDTHDAIHKQLKQMAPTVFVNTLGTTWKENLQLHAEAVNKHEAGKKLLETYQKRTDELRSKYAGSASKEISLFRPRKDKLQIYLKKNFSGIIMEDAGIVRPAAQRGTDFSKDITEEQIADLDGDIILWFNREPDAFAKLEKGSLWGTLKGVQKKAVYPVDWEYWLSGLGIQAANKVVDDLNTFAAK
ncbi:iron complex transport system substrate-binding protein [Paenibacillus sp. UNCCL117]|uniref:ABC transporter substrate-binding protein n=1 Tax=unclassified Paenibacillus TaxID=185978 RepID=UPI0008917B9E|nr:MULTISPECIES: iron-siderophore ABC transporter substrate-binding protein [unclassified Paenibacillus]SDC16902.1 iron complex transport system substrate-binding protein [Paenibacillus sp. cl123]SFW17898.1 iron complex transport system substrate-binding protein [Paenibacillus sp. UNCCL117]